MRQAAARLPEEPPAWDAAAGPQQEAEAWVVAVLPRGEPDVAALPPGEPMAREDAAVLPPEVAQDAAAEPQPVAAVRAAAVARLRAAQGAAVLRGAVLPWAELPSGVEPLSMVPSCLRDQLRRPGPALPPVARFAHAMQ